MSRLLSASTTLIGTNKFLDARLALSGTSAGKWTFAVGNTSFPPGDIPGLPTISSVSGGLPSMAISGGFTSFGRQSTNPQWQNPSLLDPKVNFTWVKGRHSLKFGYEYEKVWQEIQDSNPLYGSFTFSGGYSVVPSWHRLDLPAPAPAPSLTPTGPTSSSEQAEPIRWPPTSSPTSTRRWTARTRRTTGRYTNKLTLNLGLRWEYGSPWWERNNHISNFNLATGTLQTLTPGYTTAQSPMCGSAPCIAPFSGSGVFGKSLVNPDLTDWAPRIGFAVCRHAHHRRPRRIRLRLCPLLARRLGQQYRHQRALCALYLGHQPGHGLAPRTAS